MIGLGIQKITRFFKKNPHPSILQKYAVIGNSIDAGIIIRVDNKPTVGKKLLYIGNKCIVSGSFIYESGEGIVRIGDNTFIGGCTIISHTAVNIGNYVQIAWGTYLYDHNAHPIDLCLRRNDIIDEYNSLLKKQSDTAKKNWEVVRSCPITIEDDVWIGMNCIILRGVTIGRGSVIGAGSIIRKSVPPFCVVYGNPARVTRFIYKSDEIEEIQKKMYGKYAEFISKHEYEDLIERYLNKEV